MPVARDHDLSKTDITRIYRGTASSSRTGSLLPYAVFFVKYPKYAKLYSVAPLFLTRGYAADHYIEYLAGYRLAERLFILIRGEMRQKGPLS